MEKILTASPWMWFLITIVTVGATLVILFKKNLFPLPNFLRRSFEELMSTQIVADELNESMIAQWIKKNNAAHKSVQVLLVKCTRSYLNKLGYRPPESLDSEHNLIMILVDKGNNKVLKFQLVSFGSLNEKLQRLFNGKDEIILTD